MPHVDLSPAAAPIRTQVREAVARAWERTVEAGTLPALDDAAAAPAIEIERPAKPEHGDFATNLAMKLARPLRRAPLQIAQALAAELASGEGPIASAEAAPPGFLNLRLRSDALVATIDGILSAPGSWGRIPPVRARRVDVEFVSANPTGPLTVGNARGAFVGDLLSRVLEAGGQAVTREYYFNDSGGQITKLGASVAALARGEPVPEDGYNGGYVRDLVASMPADLRERALAGDATVDEELGTWAGGIVREGIERSLDHLGVHFDVWTTEASLHEDGWVGRAVDRLRDSGHTYERDGALWFRATAFGDVKDRVIYRGDGRPTYFAADIGYVTEKFSRGFDHLIYIWGSDHHGTVDRVRGAAEAMGYPRDHVQMSLYSWVRFIRDGVEVPMSKRTGQFITLDELLDEVGIDAARWFFASRANTTAIDFDIEHCVATATRSPGATTRKHRSSPSTTCSTPTPGSRRSPARRPRPASPRRRRWPGRSTMDRRRRSRARSCGCPRSSRMRSSPRRPRASRRTRRRSRSSSRRSTTRRRSSCPKSRSAPVAGWHWRSRPRPRSLAPSACSASPPPSRCSSVPVGAPGSAGLSRPGPGRSRPSPGHRDSRPR